MTDYNSKREDLIKKDQGEDQRLVGGYFPLEMTHVTFLFLVPFSLLPAFNHLLGEMREGKGRE